MFNWKAEIEGDRIRFLGEEYPLGHFCLELLQRALVDDAAQRVSILWAFLEPTLHELQNGLILENHLLQIRDIILPVLPYLETLPPFDRVGVSELRQSAETLLSEETAAQMMDYVKQSGALSVDQAELWAQYNYGLPKNPAKHPGKQLLEDAKSFLSEFITLANDLGDVSRWLREFVRRLNELESTKPEDLLWLASQIFHSPELSLQNHYLDEDSDTSVRHVEFTNLRAFLLTDFYEGLAHNHYPRRCPVCKRYFLMEHAYRQKYCKGYAPLELTGGPLPQATSNGCMKATQARCAAMRLEGKLRKRQRRLPFVWQESGAMRPSAITTTQPDDIWRRFISSVCLQTWGCRSERQQQDVHLFRSDR